MVIAADLPLDTLFVVSAMYMLLGTHEKKLIKDSPGINTMLVTFTTDAYADITMFGDVATTLLNMMGHSGTVPGAILAADVPAALERLKTALAEEKLKEPPENIDKEHDEDDEPVVSIETRALPLAELLAAAAKAGSNVMWQ